MVFIITDLKERINLSRDNFTDAEKWIGKYFLEHTKELETHTIEELSEKMNVSKSTITRFAKKLGYSGFIALKHAGKPAMTIFPTTQDNQHQELHAYYSLVVADYAKLFDSFLAICQFKDIEAIAKKMHEATRVFIFGVGNSGNIAKELGTKLMHVGLDAKAEDNSHTIRIEARHAKELDFMICFSVSGTTRAIKDALKLAKENNTPSVLITTNTESVMNSRATYTIVFPNINLFMTGKTLSNQIPEMFISEMLYTELMKVDPEHYHAAYAKTSSVLT